MAWDAVGHMLVDQIAWNQLQPDTREKVTKLVVALDDTYNEHRPYNFITAGAWLDDARSAPNYPYSKWHYIDVPFTFAGAPFFEPQPPHALSAMSDCVAALKTLKSQALSPPVATAMLMHLVGDIHQPLHCVDWNNDRGGNAYLIYGIPFSDLSKKSVANLHAFWDRAFRFGVSSDGKIVELYQAPKIAERPDSADRGLIHDEAMKIMAQFPKESLPQLLSAKEPRDWAVESYVAACLFAYPARPHPDNTEVVTLNADYVQRAHDIARSRIALGGYRLAEMLEGLFGKQAAH